MMVTANCVYETPCGWCSKWDKKCDKKILPTGTAAGAQVLSKYWLAGLEKKEIELKIK